MVSLITLVNGQKVKILIMGDTQKIIDKKPDDFLATMDSLLIDEETNNADFVLQMGDIVESDNDNSDRPQQYTTAQTGWRKLDGKIPYVLNIGNNDNGKEYLEKFPLSHYQAWPSFISNFDDHRNVAHHFKAGGADWLVISVQYTPTDAEMNWAEDLIQNHPDKNVIFISHAANENGSEINALKKYKNLRFVLCGHTKSKHSLKTGINGNKIGWVKTCHHNPARDSYFCVAELDVQSGTADFRYYSPQYGKYWDDSSAPFYDLHPEDSPWQWTGFTFSTSATPIDKSIDSPESSTNLFDLNQNYPNPFNNSTLISFELANASQTNLIVYNMLGENIVSLVNEHLDAGSYQIPFDAIDIPSGIYLYKLQSDNFSMIRKMSLLK